MKNRRGPRSVRRLSAEIARIPKNDENSLRFFARRLSHIARRSQGKLIVVHTVPGVATKRLVFCRDGQARLEVGRNTYAELTLSQLQEHACQPKESDDPVAVMVYQLIHFAWRLSRCQDPIAGVDVVLAVNGRTSSFAQGLPHPVKA